MIKILLKGKKKFSGRNHSGRITVHHRGGGHKRKIRFIDFYRFSTNDPYVVVNFCYDPFRNVQLALLVNKRTAKHKFVLKCQGLKIGDIVTNSFFDSSGTLQKFNIGSVYPLSTFPIGSFIHSVASTKTSKGIYARAGGSFAQVIARDAKKVVVKLPSGFKKSLPLSSRAVFGKVDIFNNDLQKQFKKAGNRRWLGIRPTVRGVAINPVDHPHGGGEGKGRTGRHPVTPWGKLTLGKKLKNK